MLASSIILLTLATTGLADEKWAVVTSKEGKFTVEMPKKPNRSRTSTSNGPNGKFTINETNLETPDGEYLVIRFEHASVIPKAVEEKFLDFTRDYFAAKFNGKVTSDKKVRLDSYTGRDFAIEASQVNVGIVNIRARQYLQGKAIYVLLVASPPNKDLPEGAAKFLGSFAFGIHPEGTTVKADKRETEAVGQELAGWGMAINPDGDVEIKSTPKALQFEIPGTLHDLVADIGKFNAPRVLKPVEGDFLAIVRVDGTFRPGPKSTKEKTVPLNTGGLVLWKDSDNYIFLMRTVMYGKGGKLNSTAMFEEREAGHRGATHNQGIPEGPLLLRLERRGTRITAGVSNDGVSWKALKPMDTTWADGPIKVGVLATNTSTEPSTVRFERYSLKLAK